jgi:hypothetical protein
MDGGVPPPVLADGGEAAFDELQAARSLQPFSTDDVQHDNIAGTGWQFATRKTPWGSPLIDPITKKQKYWAGYCLCPSAVLKWIMLTLISGRQNIVGNAVLTLPP